MEKERRRTGSDRRQKQLETAIEKRKSTERRSLETRRSGFDRRQQQITVSINRRSGTARRAFERF